MDDNYSTLIVENDSLVREGLRLLLERTEFSPQTCTLDNVEDISDVEPAILIIFAHDRTECVAMIARFRERFPTTRIVLLVAESDLEVLTSAMEAGANAILLTSISAEGLIKALQAVVAENIFIMDSRIWPAGATAMTGAQQALAVDSSLAASARALSTREVEILKRIVEGDSNKHIARRLDIAEATVKAHVKTILRKIGVSNRTQAAIWAMNNGVMQDDDTGHDADAALVDGTAKDDENAEDVLHDGALLEEDDLPAHHHRPQHVYQ